MWHSYVSPPLESALPRVDKRRAFLLSTGSYARLDFFEAQPHAVEMNIETGPGPDGHIFRHSVMGQAYSEPDPRFADALLDIEERSPDYPQVAVWEAIDGTFGVEVAVWSSSETPTRNEAAALNGTLAEILASSRI